MIAAPDFISRNNRSCKSPWHGAKQFGLDTSFDCEESFSCVLCTHRDDGRKPLSSFVAIIKKLYGEVVAFPL